MPRTPVRPTIELEEPRDLKGGTPDEREVWTSGLGQLRWADGNALLAAIDTGTADLVVADPPYAVDKDRWDRFESLEIYVDWCDQWLTEVERVLCDSGSAYVFGFSEILAEVKARSARRFAGCRWLVWYYRNKANLGLDWGRSHESILHLRKAKGGKLNVDEVRVPYNAHTKRYPQRTQAESSQYGGGRSEAWQPHPLGAKPRDVLEVPVLCNGMDEKTPHPTQKPEELIRRLVCASSPEGGLVVDPFVGSGTTAVIAERYGRRWICGDSDSRYLGVARERLERNGAVAGSGLGRSDLG